MSRKLPEPLVEDSLGAAVAFASSVLPIIKTASEFVKKQIGEMPPGAARDRCAELQLAPDLRRLRIHQLIQGHNKRCLEEGKPMLARKHVRNGAICLPFRGQEFRLLKESKFHPTRPSGIHQEGLVNQDFYWSIADVPSLPFGDEFSKEPLLNGLIYTQYEGFDLRGAYVVIPNGFIDDKVVIVGQHEVELEGDLDKYATFSAYGIIPIVEFSDNLVLGTSAVDPTAMGDPYEDAETVAEEAKGGAGSGSETVLNDEETRKSQ